MVTPIKATFENLSIYIDKMEVGLINIVNDGIFTAKSKKVGIWHTILIHHSATKEKTAVGGLYLIFKNANTDSNMALELRLIGSAKGDADTESDLFCLYIKYTFDLLTKHIEENVLKDENGNTFTLPEFQFTSDYFKFAFPD